MKTQSADLADDPMGEAEMLQSPLKIMDRSGLLEDGMDQKENLCAVQEGDVGTSALSRETSKKRNRKGRGFNLRKSLAWNQAFFIEEGVLDPQELSVISRSSAKSNENLLSVREMSSLTVYSKSSVRPPLHDLEGIARCQVFTKFSKDSKPRKLFPSSNEEREIRAVSPFVTSGKTPPTKGIARSIPRSPARNSQKRVSNARTTNKMSKLPKFVPVKSNAPLPTTSRNVTLTTNISKFAQVAQNSGIRPPNLKVDLACSSSSTDHGKNMVENCSAILKEIPSQSSSKLHERVTTTSGKVASSVPQSINHAYGGPPPPAHARPSALRMPSPSLGFFCQGKVSTSYNNQSERPTQPSESKIPSLRKPLNLRQNGQLKPLGTSVGQKPRKGTAAMNSSSASSISSNLQTCLPGSCSKPAVLDTYLRMKEKSGMKQTDIVDRKACVNFESSYLQKDSIEQLSSLKNPVPGRVKEVKYDSSSVIKNESVHNIQKNSETNVSENVDDACPSTRSSIESELSCTNASQICSPGKLIECESKEILGSGAGNYGEVIRDDTCPGAICNNHSEGDSDVASDLGCVFTATSVGCASSNEPDSFSKEIMVGVDLDDSLVVNHSLTSSSGISAQIAIPGDYELQCDSANRISSSKLDLLPRNKMQIDIPKQGVLLNAVPFSDEWVAALEAFGEDILEKKIGPVQHSPPDKVQPEPGPWSPVKKKAKDIGPFDCTKYSKNLATSSTE